jgi:hypothetical protein
MEGALRRASGRLLWFASVGALAAVVVLLAMHLDKSEGVMDSTALGLLAGGVGLLFACVAPWQTTQALRRITTFKFAGIELGLGELQRAERVRPLPREEDDEVVVGPRPIGGGAGEELRRVVDKMQARLRFSWDILEIEKKPGHQDDYRRVASWLRGAQLITQDEEMFILDLLRSDPHDVERWGATARDEYLDSGWQFAVRFGALIWDRHVRRELRRDGWFVADYPQERRHRPDFLGHCAEEGWAVMAARVAGPDHSPVALGPSRQRLRDVKQDFVAGRCIVIPDIRAVTSYDGDVQVRKLGDVLGAPKAVFA